MNLALVLPDLSLILAVGGAVYLFFLLLVIGLGKAAGQGDDRLERERKW